VDPGGWTQGDFKTVYADHEPDVRAFFTRRVGSGVAEELTAQTFFEAWSSRTHFCPSTGTAVGWIFGIARNVLRHHYRHEERRVRAYQNVASREPDTDRGIDEVALADRLDAERAWSDVSTELTRLGDDERDLLMLAGVGDLTYREIADELEIPVGTVRSRLNRSRARLRAVGGLALVAALALWGYAHVRVSPDERPASVVSEEHVPDAVIGDLAARAAQASDPGPFTGYVHQITEESGGDGQQWRDERWVGADGSGRRMVTPLQRPGVPSTDSEPTDVTYREPGALAVGALTPDQFESITTGDPAAALRQVAVINDPNVRPDEYVGQSIGIAHTLSAPGLDPAVRATLFRSLDVLGFVGEDVPGGDRLILRGPGPNDGEVQITVDRQSTLVTEIRSTVSSSGATAESTITVTLSELTDQPR
jgi:RNA polymerase sigma-70 factor (ECF subfamily)